MTQRRRTLYEVLIEAIDWLRWHFWLRFNNGADQLRQAYEAVADTADSLEAIDSAVADGDTAEALRLIALAHESLAEHITTLKGLL